MKLFKGLFIIALAIAFTIPAYAETQSIKLSGDIIIRAIDRNSWDFDDNDGDINSENYFMTNAEVQLDADLTDNVSATIRIINQRDWNVSDINNGSYVQAVDGDYGETVYYDGTGRGYSDTDDANEFKLDLDLAYITLKEFFYQPLTIRIGRQDLWFGKGFIIGANYDDPQSMISGDEWTSIRSFDAVRATWDFEPWTLDGIYAKIEENSIQTEDDVDLWGLNLGCILDYYNGEAEVYWFFKNDKEIEGGVNNYISASDECHTLGARGSFEPHEDITLWGEMAIQAGSYVANETQARNRDREAMALDVGAESRLWEEQYAWRPKLGVEYIYYSGQSIHRDHEGNDFHGWDRMFRGKQDSAIHEWYNVLHTTGMPTSSVTEDRGDTNLHQIIVMGTLQPMDNLTVNTRLINFFLVENARVGTSEKDVGNEIDVELTYEYTEDVTFGLLGAWFWTGDYYDNATPEIDRGGAAGLVTPASGPKRGKEMASEYVATCRVTF